MSIHTDPGDEILKLKKAILDTPVEVNLTDRIMGNIENQVFLVNNKIRKNKIIPLYKMLITVTASLLGLLLLIGSGFVSPAMAKAVIQIPGMEHIFRIAGDLGLKVAEEQALYNNTEASDTHEGLTLKATAVTFDGTRVAVVIDSLGNKNTDLSSVIQDVDLAINGQTLNYVSIPDENNNSGLFMFPAPNKNTLILEFSDLRNQGGKPFPDQFEATLNFNVSGIQEPFRLNIPIEKNTTNNVVLTPSIHKDKDGIQFAITKIEITPITTNITTELTLPTEPRSTQAQIHYAVFDEKGQKLEMIYANGRWSASGDKLITDTRFVPFESPPTFITIKPFKYIYKEDSKTLFEQDAEGNLKVEYLPGVEMTVPIKEK